jgi:diaminopropionate ammonia-lyase
MSFEIIQNSSEFNKKPSVKHLNIEVARKVNRFHRSFPKYEPTPIRELENLASKLGVKSIMIKDESYRFGLKAFKVLGGSYAIGSYIAEKMNMDIDELSYEKMTSEEVRRELGNITFISATDGNHGRGVAWTVNELKQSSVIYMPKGSSKERLENIRAAGAKAEITDLNYDDAVRLANEHANENGWVLIQDTSWKGYEDIPTHIMQGYTTMAYEAYQQLEGQKPTHVFLQAGVGSFAAAVTGFFASVYGEEQPVITIVEPNQAACIFKTMKENDGKIHPVTSEMNTIMAGLACGEPVTIGIEILRNYCDNFVSCPDYAAAQGMRVLSSPIKSDSRIISGESGAAGFGLFYEIMTNKDLKEWKDKLKIKEDSVLLFFSTEGDTDQESFNKIVWDGLYARPDRV